ncbi:MAG: hypothetical protein NT031_03845 [Planctomycetota bacterium]|nr:hypothetical protein [Planctomycetota bacterium]
MTEFVIIVAVVVLLAVIGLRYRRAARDKALHRWARQFGLRYSVDVYNDMEGRYPEFPCLRQGATRYTDNIIDGRWGARRIMAFDCHYSMEADNRLLQTYTTFSAVVAESEYPLKDLLIRPETLADKVSALFGFEDIDFESAEFSKAFFVQASDRKWAYDVIHARTMGLLLACPRFSVQMGGRFVIAWHDEAFSPDQFTQAAGLITGILDGLPEYVRQQRAEQAQGQ